MQRSFWTSFIAICLLILRLFSHRIYRKKGIVSMGVPGSTPTREGATRGPTPGGRLLDGLSVHQRNRASQDEGPTMGGGVLSQSSMFGAKSKNLVSEIQP